MLNEEFNENTNLYWKVATLRKHGVEGL